VVGVIVRWQRADDAHVVLGGGVDDLLHRIGRIDHDGLAGRPIAHEVGEVHHLRGDGVVDREVAAESKRRK
jgi:hypothetical protein